MNSSALAQLSVIDIHRQVYVQNIMSFPHSRGKDVRELILDNGPYACLGYAMACLKRRPKYCKCSVVGPWKHSAAFFFI